MFCVRYKLLYPYLSMNRGIFVSVLQYFYMITIKGIIGQDVSYLDVVNALSLEKNKNVEVLIDSVGGDLNEGIQIFTLLRNSGKRINTECVNNCASAASLIFLAGDKRIAGCPIMIHNPWIDGVSGNSKQLKEVSDSLLASEKQFQKLYLQRVTIDKEVLQTLMDNETYIGQMQAKNLGFATEIKNVAMAMLNNNSNTKQISKQMSKKPTKVERALAWLNGTSTAEPTVFAMVLKTLTGADISIDREEGRPELGDGATPDGFHQVEYGDEVLDIQVENDKIVDIVDSREKAEGGEGKDIVEGLLDEIEQLKAEIERLKGGASALSKEDVQMLNACRIAGKAKALALLSGAKSTYTPPYRASAEKAEPTVINPMRDRINKLKEGGK